MMPKPAAKGRRPFQDHRRIVEGIIYQYRTGIPWRDLPVVFGSWTVNCAHQHGTNLPAPQGDLWNYTNLLVEPPDHAIGHSRGGLTTKIHALCDANMRPLVLLLGTGQGGDSPMFPEVMGSLRVPRQGPGRPRTKPVRAMADKAYASKANRALLCGRRIEAVIPEKSDHIANRDDKLAATYRGGVVLRAVTIWLKVLGDTP